MFNELCYFFNTFEELLSLYLKLETMGENSKSIILDRIKTGLSKAQFREGFSDKYSKEEIYHTPEKPLIEIFEAELVKINGRFHYCEDEGDAVKKLKELNVENELDTVFCSDKNLTGMLSKAEIGCISEFADLDTIKTGVSACEYLIARFGSVLVSSAIAGARKVFSFPHTHIVIAYENQLVLEIEEGIKGVSSKYKNALPSQITNITGPSRTADIEKTLILGAHGPKELIVIIIKSL